MASISMCASQIVFACQHRQVCHDLADSIPKCRVAEEYKGAWRIVPSLP